VYKSRRGQPGRPSNLKGLVVFGHASGERLAVLLAEHVRAAQMVRRTLSWCRPLRSECPLPARAIRNGCRRGVVLESHGLMRAFLNMSSPVLAPVQVPSRTGLPHSGTLRATSPSERAGIFLNGPALTHGAHLLERTCPCVCALASHFCSFSPPARRRRPAPESQRPGTRGSPTSSERRRCRGRTGGGAPFKRLPRPGPCWRSGASGPRP
jgi:hypothetical protein